MKMKLEIGNTEIERKQTTLYLGMHIDPNINWYEHIRNLHTKISKAIIYAINRTKHYLPKTTIKIL